MGKFNFIISFLVRAAAVLAIVSCLPSCGLENGDFPYGRYGNISKSQAGNRDTGEIRRAMILYSCGYNNLSNDLSQDIEDLAEGGFIPLEGRSMNLLFVFSHSTSRAGDYITKTAPVLVKISRDFGTGSIIRDTLLRMPEGTVSSSAETLNEVLTYIRDEFPAKGYGLVFSSHATGFLPAGYYSNAGSYESTMASLPAFCGYGTSMAGPVPYHEEETRPGEPRVKSIGAHYSPSGSYEMNVMEFAAAIPMYLDYILFDACLMANVEVAYELREVCARIGFSPTEVLAEGLDYNTMAGHLIGSREPDPEGVCRDYFEYYDALDGSYRSATISLVDCNGLDALAGAVRELMGKYGDAVRTVSGSGIQRYFRGSHHWFYDFRDILVKAGVTEEELSAVDAALASCVVYKNSTPSFIGMPINSYSGLSMYLPSRGGSYLNAYYKDLKWNKATGLIAE